MRGASAESVDALVGELGGVVGGGADGYRLAGDLFGVSRLDPMTYAGVIVLLAGVSAVACWIPAWRAARVDPAVTLRAE